MKQGVYKRGNSRYLWISYIGADGRLKRETSGKTKYRDAEAVLTQKKQDIKEGREVETKKIENYLFRELCEEYDKWMQRQRSAKKKGYVVAQLRKKFGNLPLKYINTKVVEHYQTDLLQQKKKPATINRHLATLKHMFTKAAEWEMIVEDVLRRIRRVKLLEENNKRLRFLTKEECQVLIQECSAHLKPIVIAALNTGMRKGEILNLTWDRTDMQHGFILLDVTKNGERREIPINATLRETLENLPRRLDVPLVFHRDGVRTLDIRVAFAGACRRAGIRDFHFHDLRHTFASHLVMAGVDLTTVQKLLGHKTLSMTLRYAHLAPSHMVKALDILNTALNEPGSDGRGRPLKVVS